MCLILTRPGNESGVATGLTLVSICELSLSVFTWLLPQASLRLTLRARVRSHNSSSSLITTRTAPCTTTWSWPRWTRRCCCGSHTRQHAASVTFTPKSMAHKVNLPSPTETWRARTSWSRRMERVASLTSASPSSSTGAPRCDYTVAINVGGRERVMILWCVVTAGRGEEPRQDLPCAGEKLKLAEAREIICAWEDRAGRENHGDVGNGWGDLS